MCRDYVATAVDVEGHGQFVETAVGFIEGTAVNENRIRDVKLVGGATNVLFLVGEFLGVVLVEVVSRETEDFKALGGVLVAQLDEPGSLDFAGGAPGGPEIDEDSFALVVGQRDFLACQVFEGEVGGGLPGERGDKLGVTAGGVDYQFAFGDGCEQAIGGLFPVFVVGPAGPCKGGQNEQHRSEDECVSFHGERDLSLNCTSKRGFVNEGSLRGKKEAFGIFLAKGRGAHALQTGTNGGESRVRRTAGARW